MLTGPLWQSFMISKRRLHHYWRLANKIKTWQLLVMLPLSLALSTWALRQNSLGLAPRVKAVIVADRDNGDVDGALRELANYVANHMNTRLSSPVQLPYTYQRAVDALIKNAEVKVNSQIYQEAQAICEDPSIILAARAACIQEYVIRNAPPGKEPQQIEFPDPAIYTYAFVSPAWSPDLAGWSVLFSALLLISLSLRLVLAPLASSFFKSHK